MKGGGSEIDLLNHSQLFHVEQIFWNIIPFREYAILIPFVKIQRTS